jgi:arginyl-tRNA synthetase
MILPIHDTLRERLSKVIAELYGLPPETMPVIVLDYAPSRELGDLAMPLAFDLARRLRKAPRAIAAEIAGALGDQPGLGRAEATPNGYLNFRLDRRAFLLGALGAQAGPQWGATTQGKTIVEHTAINPNKAAHVGHLRNAALGDTLGRVLRFRGVPVEIQNYIDDTGVQVADVVVGFRQLERMSLAQVREIADTTRFDYYCWDLYARVTEWYREDQDRLAVRRRHCTKSSTAATKRRRWPVSQQIASSGCTWIRWRE